MTGVRALVSVSERVAARRVPRQAWARSRRGQGAGGRSEDRWSRGVFFRELTILYDTFSKNERNPLPELPLQYTDFAVWQRQFLSGKNLEKQLSY